MDGHSKRFEVIAAARHESTATSLNRLAQFFKDLVRITDTPDPAVQVASEEAWRVHRLATDMRAREKGTSWVTCAQAVLESDEFALKPELQQYREARLRAEYPRIVQALRCGDFNTAYAAAVRASRKLPFALSAFTGVVTDEVDTLACTQQTDCITKLLHDGERLVSRAGAGMFVAIERSLKDDVDRSNFLHMLMAKVAGEFEDGTSHETLSAFLQEFDERTAYRYHNALAPTLLSYQASQFRAA